MNYYTGTHNNDLDPKGRVVIPRAFRKVPKDILDADLFLSPNPVENCVDVYPEPVWEMYVDRIAAADDLEVGESDDLIADLFADADRTKVDGQNRLVLSHALREELGVDGIEETSTLAFVGAGSHFKIYLASDYGKERLQRRERKAELLKKYKSGPNRRLTGAGGDGK